MAPGHMVSDYLEHNEHDKVELGFEVRKDVSSSPKPHESPVFLHISATIWIFLSGFKLAEMTD